MIRTSQVWLRALAAKTKIQKKMQTEPTTDAANRASSLLAKWPENAPRAFWEAMKEGDTTEVAMAIVMDPSYGLNKLNEEARDLDDVAELRRFKRVPLYLAVRAKRPDIVSALLVAGADPSYVHGYNHNTLSEACELGDLESCKALLAAGASIKDDGLMFDAARGGNADIIKLLATKGLSVEGIHTAAEKGHTAAVEAILDLGEDVDVLSQGEESINSALTFAAENGHIETVKLLVSRGANINLRPNGDTALDVAVQQNNIALIKTLLALGADPKDDKGFRSDFRGGEIPVYSCNNVKSVEVATLLTSHGAVTKLAYLNNEQVPEPVLEYYFEQLLLTKKR